jgi:hypothetical protein
MLNKKRGTVTLHIEVPRETWEAAKHAALRERRTLSQLVNVLLEAALKPTVEKGGEQ